jgi:hypothetical protein
MKLEQNKTTGNEDHLGYDRDAWLAKLALISKSLQKQGSTAQLTLVGSATGLLNGQPGRTTIDLDVWRPTSKYARETLKTAVEEAGVLFDPKFTIEPEVPYVQMIDPGLVQTGKFEHTELLEQFGALQLHRPPIANLIASKLIRAAVKDLQDITFLLANYRPEREAIARAIRSMPAPARKQALENKVYLDVLDPPNKAPDIEM